MPIMNSRTRIQGILTVALLLTAGTQFILADTTTTTCDAQWADGHIVKLTTIYTTTKTNSKGKVILVSKIKRVDTFNYSSPGQVVISFDFAPVPLFLP